MNKVAFLMLLSLGILVLIASYYLSFNIMTPGPLQELLFRKKTKPSPWDNVPYFTLYLRFTSSVRFVAEYRNVLLRTMKVFYPAERAKLLLVLDDEKEEDHELGAELQNEWPYPDTCFMEPGDPSIYHRWGKGRMFYDMMHPDKCTDMPYVGFVDTDTFFSTLVTPDLLFENGKPVIVAKIGQPPYQCWEKLSEIFLGRKEVMQCMSAFPIMIKTSHMKEMREVLAKEQNKSFNAIFRDSATKSGGTDWGKATGGMECMCQFSIMCNYVWYTHRDEYAWHLQMVPNGDWKGQNWVRSMVPADYYHTEVKPEEKIPIPRISIHLRYTITNGQVLNQLEPSDEDIDGFYVEGLCYSGGFQRCPEKCEKYDKSEVQYNLYSFEFYQWFWDDRCYSEQEKHFRKLETYMKYYEESNFRLTMDIKKASDICKVITNFQQPKES